MSERAREKMVSFEFFLSLARPPLFSSLLLAAAAATVLPLSSSTSSSDTSMPLSISSVQSADIQSSSSLFSRPRRVRFFLPAPTAAISRPPPSSPPAHPLCYSPCSRSRRPRPEAPSPPPPSRCARPRRSGRPPTRTKAPRRRSPPYARRLGKRCRRRETRRCQLCRATM